MWASAGAKGKGQSRPQGEGAAAGLESMELGEHRSHISAQQPGTIKDWPFTNQAFEGFLVMKKLFSLTRRKQNIHRLQNDPNFGKEWII